MSDAAPTLSRSDLESGRMRELYIEAVGDPGHALDDEQLSESLTATLAAKPKGAGWWVFAYGSLLWNPLFPVAETRPAIAARLAPPLLPVVARVARHAASARASCSGSIAAARAAASRYRLPAPLAIDELHLLWRREMVVGSYHPRWVQRRRRRARARRAHIRRPPRPSAVRGPAVARRARRDVHRATRAARSARRSTISSARASRSSRTASSIRISSGWRARSRRCTAR